MSTASTDLYITSSIFSEPSQIWDKNDYKREPLCAGAKGDVRP